MALKSAFLVVALFGMTIGCRYPKWPQEFEWSSAGAIDGMVCTRILERSDPDTWRDNYFCHKAGCGIKNVGMKWSSKGQF